jgi:flavin reductase (DIM6/NTAB) family NADH-FMN oxidoreductase RutF
VTIHSGHPFPTEDDPVRRLRGRVTSRVSLWTAADAGLTVSSLMVANGDPARVLCLLDPDSDLGESLAPGDPLIVQLLTWRHRNVAEAFAGVAPAPGGPFRTAEFTDTEWGRRLVDATTWAGVRVESAEPRGWSILVTATIEHVEAGEDDEPLFHHRGRFHR